MPRAVVWFRALLAQSRHSAFGPFPPFSIHPVSIHPVSTHPSVLEELVDGSHIRWGLRVLKAVVSACLLDGYSADRLGS
jgi:hypothetical protein